MPREKITPDKTRVKRKYTRRKDKSLSKLLTDPQPVLNPESDISELGQLHMIVSTINAMDKATKNRVLNYIFSRFGNHTTSRKWK